MLSKNLNIKQEEKKNNDKEEIKVINKGDNDINNNNNNNNMILKKKGLQLLRHHYQYDQFNPGQWEAIQACLEKKDCLILRATSSGKSISFILPALITKQTVVVISPLVSLMADQCLGLKRVGISVCTLNQHTEEEVWEKAAQGFYSLVYISPEGLPKWLNGIESLIKNKGVCMFAIDECHACSEWGLDFRPNYRRLHVLRERFPDIPIMALTATATPRVQQDVMNQLRFREDNHIVLRSTFNRPNLTYTIKLKTSLAKDITLELIGRGNACIIYCLKKKDTEKLARYIKNKLGYTCAAYHAGLSADIRQTVHTKFIKNKLQVVCATIAFGMGIDHRNIRKIIHYGMVKSLESYVQQTGRAGRDGLPSECVMFYNDHDINGMKYLLKGSATVNQELFHYMIQFLETQQCRRQLILEYFGESHYGNCNSCDNCLFPSSSSLNNTNTNNNNNNKNKQQWRDITVESRLICQAIKEKGNGECAIDNIIDYLKGTTSNLPLKKSQNVNNTLKLVPSVYLESVINILIAHNLLLSIKKTIQPNKKKAAFSWNVLQLSPEAEQFRLDPEIILAPILITGEMYAALKNHPFDPSILILSNSSPDISSSSSSSSSLSPIASLPPFVGDDRQKQLLEKLIEWRKEQAMQDEIHLETILNTNILYSIAKMEPTDEVALSDVPEMSCEKILEYGIAILELIHQFQQTFLTSIPKIKKQENKEEDFPHISIRKTKRKLISSPCSNEKMVNTYTNNSVPIPNKKAHFSIDLTEEEEEEI